MDLTRPLRQGFARQILRSLGAPLAALATSGCCYDVDSTQCIEWEGAADACPSADDARSELGADEVNAEAVYWPAREYLIDGETFVEPAECCYPVTNENCSEMRGFGRPFSDARGALMARGRGGAAAQPWVKGGSLPDLSGLTGPERAQLARTWAERGLMEHASIASLGRFALELMALGGDPELVLLAHRAAADEVRHARLCFGLASAYAGEPIAPGAFPFRDARVSLSPDLASFARRTAREGCLEETLGVAELAERLARASDPAVRRVLAALLHDERRHAELAWRAVAWAVRLGGDPVRAALVGAFDPPGEPAHVPRGSSAIAAHGEIAPDVLRAAALRAHHDVVLPCARAALAS